MNGGGSRNQGAGCWKLGSESEKVKVRKWKWKLESESESQEETTPGMGEEVESKAIWLICRSIIQDRTQQREVNWLMVWHLNLKLNFLVFQKKSLRDDDVCFPPAHCSVHIVLLLVLRAGACPLSGSVSKCYWPASLPHAAKIWNYPFFPKKIPTPNTTTLPPPELWWW